MEWKWIKMHWLGPKPNKQSNKDNLISNTIPRLQPSYKNELKWIMYLWWQTGISPVVDSGPGLQYGNSPEPLPICLYREIRQRECWRLTFIHNQGRRICLRLHLTTTVFYYTPQCIFQLQSIIIMLHFNNRDFLHLRILLYYKISTTPKCSDVLCKKGG